MKLCAVGGILVVLSLVISITVADNHTDECMRRASFTNCAIFNNCCDFRCSRSKRKRSTCISHLGQIQQPQSECVCSATTNTSPQENRRLSRLDLIAGVFLLFVVDMLMLTFTF